MRLALLMATVVGCGGAPDCFTVPHNDNPRPTAPCTVVQLGGWIDEAILPYAKSFSEEATARSMPCLHTPVIGFVDRHLPEDQNVLGYCMYTIDVVLVREYWNWLTPESRRTLVYHELGHCALLRSHTDPNVVDIMNPYLISDSVAVPQWDRLVNKLFTGKEE